MSRVPRSQRGTIAPTKKLKSKAVLKADNSSSRTQLMTGVLKELKSARTYIIGKNLRIPHKNLLRALKKKGDDSHGLGGDAFRFFNTLNDTQKKDIGFWLSKNVTASKIFLKFLQKTEKKMTIETFWFAKDDMSSLSALKDQKDFRGFMSLFEEMFEFYDVSNLKKARVLVMEPATRAKLKTLHQQWLVFCMDEIMDTLLNEIDVNLSDPFSRMKSELEDEQSTKVGESAKKLWSVQKENKKKGNASHPWYDANKKKGKLFKKYIKDVDPLAMVEFEGWNAVMELKSKRIDPTAYMVSFQQVVVRFVDPKERELKGKHFVEKKIDPFSGRAVVNVNVSPFVLSRSNKFIGRCKTLGYI